MPKTILFGLILALVLVGILAVQQPSSADKTEPMVAHMVYFTLKDNSPQAAQKLVDACKKYLSRHDGEVYFSAGTRALDLKRPVNDQEFDVGLHVVFQNMAAHDKYQDHPRHKEFITANKENWKKVRVFDSLVTR